MAVCPSCQTQLPRKFRAELAVREYLGCPACQEPLQLKRRPAVTEALHVLVGIVLWAVIGDLMWHEAIVIALWMDTLFERYAPWRQVVSAAT